METESATPAAEKPKRKRAPKQQQMPGTARKDVNQEIENAAARYVEIRDERMQLTKQEVQAQAELLSLMKEHKLTIYRCATEELEVEIVAKDEKAKVRKLEAPSAEGEE